MKKNIFLGMFAAAGVLLAASCSQENLNSQTWEGEEATVSFTIGLENSVQTRAISDGTGVNQLTYAIYDKEGNSFSDVPQVTVSTSFPATVSIALGVYQDYQVVFWAQNSACTAYGTDDLREVTVNYGTANNDDTRDAFYGTTGVFSISGSSTKTVTLTRPFAQVNVGVTKDDWDAAQELKLDIQSSAVTIKNAGTQINLLTGEVSGTATEVTYTAASIPAQATPEEILTVDGTEYKWLSMSYILVADGSEDGTTKTTLESLAYTFTPESGNTINFSNGLTSVPVQRNHRTNIIGQILTGDLGVSITVDQDFDEGAIVYPETSEEELILAAAYGGTVTLQGDVELDETLVIAEGVSTVIDLNSYSITYAEAGTTSAKTLTKADTGTDCIILVKGSLEINGAGTVGSSSKPAITVESTGTLVINGGTYYFDPTTYVATATHTITTGTDSSSATCYTVEEIAPTTVSDETALLEAIADGALISLTTDITLTSGLDIPAYDDDACDYGSPINDVTIVLNGNTLTSSSSYVIRLGSGSSLTITGEGTVGDSSNTNSIYNSGGDLTINGGTYAKPVRCLDGGSVTVTDGTFNGVFYAYGTTTDITGGTFNSSLYIGDYSTATISGVTCNGTLTVEYGCTASITSGTFAKLSNDGDLVIDGGTFTGALTCTGNTTINGGTFESSVTYSGESLTINGGAFSGSMNFSASAKITNGSFDGNFNCDYGTLTISGGTYDGTLNCCDDVVIDISGGTFTGGLYSGYSTGGGTIKISGGTFTDTCTLTCYEGDEEYSIPAGTITITGGTFYNTYYSSFLESGYSATETQDGSGTTCYVVAANN